MFHVKLVLLRSKCLEEWLCDRLSVPRTWFVFTWCPYRVGFRWSILDGFVNAVRAGVYIYILASVHHPVIGRLKREIILLLYRCTYTVDIYIHYHKIPRDVLQHRAALCYLYNNILLKTTENDSDNNTVYYDAYYILTYIKCILHVRVQAECVPQSDLY